MYIKKKNNTKRIIQILPFLTEQKETSLFLYTTCKSILVLNKVENHILQHNVLFPIMNSFTTDKKNFM